MCVTHATKSKGETDDQGQGFLERKYIFGNDAFQAFSGCPKRSAASGLADSTFSHTANSLLDLRTNASKARGQILLASQLRLTKQ